MDFGKQSAITVAWCSRELKVTELMTCNVDLRLHHLNKSCGRGLHVKCSPLTVKSGVCSVAIMVWELYGYFLNI